MLLNLTNSQTSSYSPKFHASLSVLSIEPYRNSSIGEDEDAVFFIAREELREAFEFGFRVAFHIKFLGYVTSVF